MEGGRKMRWWRGFVCGEEGEDDANAVSLYLRWDMVYREDGWLDPYAQLPTWAAGYFAYL
jgi:hypothetical protein